mmetsp:Transcript_16460/g.24888  ORF Transcript_16460/g.24888 Transcript_16460/m.24888 type:complete len:589 (+) Transcript_16460:192-1958(+)
MSHNQKLDKKEKNDVYSASIMVDEEDHRTAAAKDNPYWDDCGLFVGVSDGNTPSRRPRSSDTTDTMDQFSLTKDVYVSKDRTCDEEEQQDEERRNYRRSPPVSPAKSQEGMEQVLSEKPTASDEDDDNSNMATFHPKRKRCNGYHRVLVLVLILILVSVLSVIGIFVWKHISNNNKDEAALSSIASNNENQNQPGTTNPSLSPSADLQKTPLPTSIAPTNKTHSISFQPSNMPSTSTPSVTPSFEPSITPSTSEPSATPSSLSPSQLPSQFPTTFDERTFSFYVMGDVPYAPWEEVVLREQLQSNLTTFSDARFVMHVGDFQKPPRTKCHPDIYEKVASIFSENSALPFMVLPGDNDWIDCPDPTESLALYRSTFTMSNANTDAFTMFNNFPFDIVQSNPKEYPELTKFEHQGILFLTVHVTDTKSTSEEEEWKNRMTANVNHVWNSVQEYANTVRNPSQLQPDNPPTLSDLRAVVIFGHGQYSVDGTREFFRKIQPVLDNSYYGLPENLPVLYLHGDGHRFSIDTRASNSLGWKSLVDVQVDQGAFADVMLVQVGHNLVVENSASQHVFFNGLIRIDRQGGRYPERN